MGLISRAVVRAQSQSATIVARRFLSSSKPPTSTTLPSPTKQQPRLDRLLNRSPKFLHRYIVALKSAPLSHITSFLLLHELTAVIPLFTLAGSFHYYNWLPPYFAEGAWVVGGVEKFGRYFRRKGWISDVSEAELEERADEGQDLRDVETNGQRAGKWWNRGEGSVRIVVEFATAYAIVKAFLIPRLVFSAWAAPGFAKWTVIPLSAMVTRSRLVQGIRGKISKTSK